MELLYKISLVYVIAIKAFRTYMINFCVSILFTKRNNIDKILINRDGAFGDSIVALPALSIIRQNFPQAKIDLVTITNNGVSFDDFELEEGLINNIYCERKKNRRNLLKILKKNNYDLFIQLPQNLGLYKSIRNIIIVRFILNIENAFGWDYGRIKSFITAQKKYLFTPTERKRLLDNLKYYGLSGKINYPIKKIRPANKIISSLLKEKIIVFIIGGKLKIKKWPLDNWVTLSKLVACDYKIIIIGGKTEIDEAEYIKSQTSNTYNFCNKLSISELYYVFTRSFLAISNDTGAMHLCDAAGIRLISLFSTKELSAKWYPNNKNSVVIENKTSIEKISADDVYKKLEEII